MVGPTLAVHGAKGGVGASLLASQLALDAASRARAALIDLDVTGGTCSALLGLAERGSMLSLLRRGAGPAEVAAAARCHPSGLAVLAPEPFDPSAGLLDATAVGHLLGLARGCFDVVVVDVPARLDDRGLAALTAADVTLLTVTPEVPCVLAARRVVDALALRRFPLGRLGVVVNMLVETEGVTPEQIAAALAGRLTGTLPFSPEAVRQAVNAAPDHNGLFGPGTVRTAVAAISSRLLRWIGTGDAASPGDATGETPGGGGHAAGGERGQGAAEGVPGVGGVGG